MVSFYDIQDPEGIVSPCNIEDLFPCVWNPKSTIRESFKIKIKHKVSYKYWHWWGKSSPTLIYRDHKF